MTHFRHISNEKEKKMMKFKSALNNKEISK